MDSATTKKSDKNFSKKLIDLNKNGSSLEASPTESTTTPVRFFLIHRVLKQWAMEFQWSLFRVYSEEKEKCTGGCWHLISKWRQKTEVHQLGGMLGVFGRGFFAKPVMRTEEESYRYIMALDH
ncbi:unnamed protein product [Dracunculus medinensis]|uniref:DUF1115 domain-containing protein n=1 Tax=Dracunculus medinensis TaxID=318479 RepID=A0A0N4U3Q2_DRAME|nr:unnamed protein product [Dracunculus medinensis]